MYSDCQEIEFFEIFNKYHEDMLIIHYHPNGQINKQIQFNNGVKCGIERKYTDKGQLIQEHYNENGMKTGIQREYLLGSGTLQRETPYIDDIKQGVQIDYYSNGDIKQETPYKNDKITGIMIMYYGSNIIWQETPFVENKLHGIRKQYYINGKLKEEINYIEDRKSGTYKEYYQSGKIKSETIFINNKREGLQTEYFESGTKQRETNYLNNQRHGFMRFYYQNGQIMITVYYEKGLLSCIPKKPLLFNTQQPDFTNFDKCSICFEPQEHLIDPIALKCSPKHIFCTKCIETYIQKEQTVKCPLCRYVIQ